MLQVKKVVTSCVPQGQIYIDSDILKQYMLSSSWDLCSDCLKRCTFFISSHSFYLSSVSTSADIDYSHGRIIGASINH